MRALLVEDSHACAHVGIHILRNRGYHVERQATAHGARAACDNTLFDLYVVDAGLPDGCGVDLVETIRAGHLGARIILWSSSDREADARRLGVAFVDKNEEAAALAATIDTMNPKC